jgi:hypothetical protein
MVPRPRLAALGLPLIAIPGARAIAYALGAVSVIAWAACGKTSSTKAMAPVANDMIAVCA